MQIDRPFFLFSCFPIMPFSPDFGEKDFHPLDDPLLNWRHCALLPPNYPFFLVSWMIIFFCLRLISFTGIFFVFPGLSPKALWSFFPSTRIFFPLAHILFDHNSRTNCFLCSFQNFPPFGVFEIIFPFCRFFWVSHNKRPFKFGFVWKLPPGF